MKVRITLVCTLLLLAAVPTFALPLCGHCNLWNQCESAPGDFERCKYDLSGNCITTWERCSIPRSDSTVLADWKVVSIETSSVATECVTDAAPAAEASTPAPQTTELSN